MATDRPLGERFSRVYLERGEPVSDSQRMRIRLARWIADSSPSDFDDYLSRELGIPLLGRGGYTYIYQNFMQSADLPDVLDTVTLYIRHKYGNDRSDNRLSLACRYVERIFREENTHYTIDRRGGVHYYVDREFQDIKSITITALANSRYANARSSFDLSHAALDRVPPDGKTSIREVFHSCEGLFRLMFPKAGILGGDEINNHLIRRIPELFSDDIAARTAANMMARSFREWVIAAHQYRHELGTEEVAQPPLDLAILMVSQGGAYVRWLISIDSAIGH